MFRVRPATSTDTDRCVEIVAGLPDYFTADVAVEVARALPAGTWVVCEGAALIGFTTIERRDDAAEIIWLAVDAAARRRGAGTALLEALVAGLAADGVRALEAKTLDESAGYEPYVATHAFWRRRGFVKLDVIDPLPGWQPGNPCAIYVRTVTR